ncbi:putative inactive receptor kinase [Vitis vinifera]|uniref:Putative inactive receptor kinase n=1 Tax=Vitis vinifera TaxID=29760 RepID=A0A438BM97_VITVI|nr:putative inactive receptor kinase [Vitis vinifera]
MSIAFLFVQETVEGVVVAVKRLKDVSVSKKEFREKVKTVGAIDHENLVPPRAYYCSKDEKLIVYGYMSMGSLSTLLHGNRRANRTLPIWESRSGIALGAARGIAYIHSRGSASPHGDIKSSNILLTKSYEAQVSNFGLAHLVGPIATPNCVAGFCAPEATNAHKSMVQEDWTVEVFDLELLRYQNVEKEMVQLLKLALDYVRNEGFLIEQEEDNVVTMHDVMEAQWVYNHYRDESYLRWDIMPFEVDLTSYKRSFANESIANA